MSFKLKSAAILLAAGGSTRLGRPKQLLRWEDTTLLGTALKRLADAGCGRLIVVLGAYESELREHCVAPEQTTVEIVTNRNWSAGQAGSLKVGVEHVLATESNEAIMVALCDQPLIASEHYRRLLSLVIDNNRFAAATEYHDGLGVPACFSRSALMSLSVSRGEGGAKKWLRAQDRTDIERVSCPAAQKDIDTDLDYQNICNLPGCAIDYGS